MIVPDRHEGAPGAWVVGELQRTAARDLTIQLLRCACQLRWTVVMARSREKLVPESRSEDAHRHLGRCA
jgi:hypothetical protein